MKRTDKIILAAILIVLFSTLTLVMFGWGYLVGAGLTWMGILDSPWPSVRFFMALNILYAVLSILKGKER